MATLINFKCKLCNQNFLLSRGLLQKDLLNIKDGSDLPGGGKLPSKELFEHMYNEKTLKTVNSFIDALDLHSSKCHGEIILESLAEAH